MLYTLAQCLNHAQSNQYAVPCFNVFGVEDALAVIQAAEQSQSPVILATNKEMVEFMGVDLLASMLGKLAGNSVVPIVVHLDHCYDVNIAIKAIDAGYSSVMYDGSQLPLEENILNSRKVADYAKPRGVSVEAEIGSVPYSKGRDYIKSELTNAETAKIFAEQTEVDAVAVSVGNTHRLETAESVIDHERLAAIAALVSQPLVIHGTSGIPDTELVKLARTEVCKFNIGTSLRMAFGASLRKTLEDNPSEFDRLTIMQAVMPAIQNEAVRYCNLTGAAGQANSCAALHNGGSNNPFCSELKANKS